MLCLNRGVIYKNTFISCYLSGLSPKRKPECASFSGFRLHPHAAAVTLYNFFRDRKPDACAFVFRFVVQALEDDEDLFAEFRINANAIVKDEKFIISFFAFADDGNG